MSELVTAAGAARPLVQGIPVDNLSMSEVVDRVDATIRARGQCSILAVNPEKIMAAQQRPELAQALQRSELLIPDGIGVVLALRLKGQRVAGRVPGSELMPELCALAARRGYGVYLFGAREATNAFAAEVLVRMYPGLHVVGRHHGYVADADMEDVVDDINRSRAKILFVALGSPAQEIWIGRYRARLGVSALQGVGGTFDVIAGSVKRAPLLWRRLNLEWLFRLLAQPRRLLRQTAIPRFAYALVKEALGRSRVTP
jgi:N-acetylglucosaminyldiphosphoundecaprenol N-acetyl-beta-D-mannosaminyltransferase